MIGKPFINEVINKAIEDYLKYKETPNDIHMYTFPVVAIRTLIFIYGELDIINPYITKNEHSLGGFNSNITKYGFKESKLQDFKDQFLKFGETSQRPNYAFLNIEKYLIEMYFCKQKAMGLTLENQEEFKSYLYLEENTNPYIMKSLDAYVVDKQELTTYFNSLAFENAHSFNIAEIPKEVLIPDAYTILGYNLDQIGNMPNTDLRNINNQVYQFFHIDPKDENKDTMLQKAVNYYQKYGNRITSGNGYVDLLLFLSVISTAIFITLLFTFKIL